ncbi:MAG: pyrophosphokinae [Blastocatellia bacterium]|jgi:ppGpp synthetase/RelA/SpoT-type nucleotidyltranferase|nr:pyrophosphokinae [Blastocatellia bacterium]
MAGLGEMSKTQIDRLGDRLRKENIQEADLRLLDVYRRSFAEAYEDVVGRIRDQLALEPTGRPAKSTTSISDKLRRETIRLSQMQDIAGCRVIVPNIESQDKIVIQLKELFERSEVDDRRARPSHGYRAVHVIVDSGGKLIEIQVRTELQHAWAELSEKLSDVVDGAIKYGGGKKEVASLLASISDATLNLETAIRSADIDRMILEFQRGTDLFNQLPKVIRRAKEEKDALPN